MKRRFTIVTAALALLTFLAVPMGMWGQTRDTKTETFENQSAGTTYNSTQNYQATNSVCGIGWSIYYGTVSTTGPITGSKSAQMRWYKNSSTNYPYLKSTTAIDGLTNVAFKAKVGNTNLKMDVHYSSDGTTWTALATAVTFSNTNVTDCSYAIPSGGKYIKIGVSSSSTTTSSNFLSLLVDDVVFTYSSSVNTYTVTYHANVTGTADTEVVYNEGDDVTVAANTFSNPGYDFTLWNTEADGSGTSYNPGDVIEDINSDIDFYAQWEVSTSPTGNIKFGSSTGHVAINAASVTDDDDLGNEWTITTEGTEYFSQNAVYSQVGSGNNPATSITFTTTLPEEVNVTAMEVKFGGFSGTAGTITMKVGSTTIGTGSLNGNADVTENSTSTETGDVLTVTVTNISKGVKAYYISYTYEAATPNPAVATTTTINVPANFNTDIYTSTTAGTLTATVTENVDNTAISGTTVTWSSSNTGVATIDANGVVTLVAVGTTTITASYAGVEDVYRPSEATYELNVTSSEPIPGTETDPYTVAEAITFIDGLGGETSAEVYVTGIISQIDSYNSSYHSITYWISDDGTTTSQLEVYSGKGLNGANFNSINDLIVGSTVTVKGNLKKYNDVYEFNYNSVIVSLTPPAKYTLTAAMTNVAEYFVFVGDDAIELDENNQAQVSAGATVYVSLTMEDCYALTSLTVNGSTTGITEEEPGVYYSFVMPEGDVTIGVSATQATEYTLTVVGTENVTFDMLAGADSDPVTLTNGTASLCEQMFVLIADLTANPGLVLQSVTLTAGGSTTALTPEYGVYTFNMPSSDATLTFTTATAPTYTLASSIESGKTYIIVGFDNDDNAYAMGEQKSNNRAGVGIIVDGNTATGNASVHEVVITALDGDDAGKYTIEDDGYLYASSSSGNQLKTESALDENGNGKWTIVFEDGEATITAQGNNSRKLMRFNPNNGNPLFACYATSSSTGSLPRLYVKDETPTTETYTLTITGYTNDNTKDGYYLIASPVNVDPSTVTGMTDGDFDLYYFDESKDDEWRNYEANPFNLVPGKGYLYAKKATNETPSYSFELTGIPYNNEPITLSKSASGDFPGWNLVGNPFGEAVYLSDIDRDFYVMNTESGEIIQGSGAIDPKQGFFVIADENGEELEFISTLGGITDDPNGELKLVLNLTKSNSLLDRAVVRFGEGRTLPKFMLNQDNTKLYITEGNQDYAVVRSDNAGEMPVNFKAAENGNYTLSVEAENVEVSYLHLIDNLTGTNVDLLATPTYSFEARTIDSENRFCLMFNTNGVDENTTTVNFAYFNGSSWTINDMGEATLQVIDMMGRVLSTQAINGNTEVSISQVPGVYMLRLVNGNDVKVQKVVVR